MVYGPSSTRDVSTRLKAKISSVKIKKNLKKVDIAVDCGHTCVRRRETRGPES